jgi:hypothetical protein
MTRTIDKEFEGEIIVVPSGTEKDDWARSRRARNYAHDLEQKGKKVKYILSGIGPDLNKRLGQECSPNRLEYQAEFYGERGLDVHPGLWDFGIKQTRNSYFLALGEWQPFGVDTQSIDSIENMINTFYGVSEGTNHIVSRKLHNVRFRLMEKELRKLGYIPKEVEINYVNTDEGFSLKNTVRDVLSLAKYFVFGKKKLRNLAQRNLAEWKHYLEISEETVN